ncbi:hypothetical protein [Aeromicrobium sp. 179-A 4D2 NHS]|uniref:hypothetical protein n=1 Tax=Aeromicrobium sp. 179-A 4D2 NHS TaxID=3142375 RepID=UPI0039A1575D
MTTSPDEPQPSVDPDLEPAAEPADAVEQQREVWENADDALVPDPERPVPIDDDEDDEA